jgi:cytochrome c biogenesis protein CcmG/thiol:disulfide interchange protein DsbE
MRAWLAAILVGVLPLATASAGAERVAPDWTLQKPDGEYVTLSEVAAERPVVLLFWATWCPYCKALMPHLQSIGIEYGESIEILAIHFRDDKGDPVGFVREAGYGFTLVEDGDDVAKANGVWSTPGLLIVDRDRNVRFDIYTVPRPDMPQSEEESGHRRKAAYRAPYWAAAIRESLDAVLSETAP